MTNRKKRWLASTQKRAKPTVPEAIKAEVEHRSEASPLARLCRPPLPARNAGDAPSTPRRPVKAVRSAGDQQRT